MPAPKSDPPVSREALAVTRQKVRELLESSQAFRGLDPETQQRVAGDTVQVLSYLAEPQGMRAAAAPVAGGPPLAGTPIALADPVPVTAEPPKFVAGAAKAGAEAAGALLQAVSFPQFVTGLVTGVFHSIVTSTIEQMQAYGKLVADVAKSLNDFRDENTTANQGRDHLVEQFPDLFSISVDSGDGGEAMPRVKVNDDVDERAALKRLASLPVEGPPLTSLDDDVVEERLVPAARTQMATSRQQLLATMVMMGIQRIVVTDGKIQAKVMYDFQARDNMKYQQSATKFDYDKSVQRNVQEGSFDSGSEGTERTHDRAADGSAHSERRDGSWYAKGNYRNTQEPVLNLVSTMNASGDSTLTTKASLAGVVDINFKSDYLPLEKMVDPAQIAQLQLAAQPARTPTAIGRPPAASATPAATPPPAARP